MKLKTFALLLHCFLALVLSGCGTMKVKETYYYAVEDENNTNIYRLQREATSQLGDAKYQTGFFPADAVDRAFGAVSGSGTNVDLQFQESIKTEIRNATLYTTQEYLNVAKNKDSTAEDIQNALNARRNILAYPSMAIGLPNHSRIIDYEPGKNIAIRNSDSKMVYVFSSDPDTVIGNIKNFAESDQTALSVSRLAQVTSQQMRNEVAEEQATIKLIGKSTSKQINYSVSNIIAGDDGGNDANKLVILEQLEILKSYLKGIKQ